MDDKLTKQGCAAPTSRGCWMARPSPWTARCGCTRLGRDETSTSSVMRALAGLQHSICSTAVALRLHMSVNIHIGGQGGVRQEPYVRPVHLLRVFLLRVLESNFPGDSLYNSTDIGISTPYN